MPVPRLHEELYHQNWMWSAHEAHPEWTDEVNRTETVKARWTQEEISLLARREAELSLRGVRFINQELLGFLPDRTLDSIKSMSVQTIAHLCRSTLYGSIGRPKRL